MRSVRTVAAGLLITLAACGGGGDSQPTQPQGGTTQTLSTIRLPASSLALAAGATTTLVPSALDASGRVITGASGYTYSSSASSVAEVQSNATVLGLGAGTATITVSLTRDGVTATTTTTVTVTGSLAASATVTGGNDLAFSPPTVIVARNATVSYAFGTVTHNVAFRTTVGAPANVPNTSSATVARVFPTAGDFTYDCTLHGGMTGQVVVR